MVNLFNFKHFVSCILIVFCLSTVECLIIETQTGVLSSIKITAGNGKPVNAFYGIPYAEPPIGNLRFKAAEPVKPWPDMLKAHALPKSCINAVPDSYRKPGLDWWIPDKSDESEDCLFLNVITPIPTPRNATVMVFVHGGGFEGGAGSLEKYNGTILASEENIIYVSINYRLSIFGFLYLDSTETEGNLGLKDQALALRWIKNNIALFGGDPNKVTLFGAGAGASSIGFHLFLYSSQTLFRRAILKNGVSTATWAYTYKRDATQRALAFSKLAGCGHPTNVTKMIMECLRKKTPMELVAAALKTPTGFLVTFGPVVEGSYIPEQPKAVLDTNKELMIGDTSHAGSYFMLLKGVLNRTENSYISDQVFTGLIQNFVSPLFRGNDMVPKLVKFTYTNWEDPDNLSSIRDQAVEFFGDFVFKCSINYFSDAASLIGNKVYRFVFNQAPSVQGFPKWAGTTHGDELDFVFGKPLDNSRSYSTEEKELARVVMSSIVQFANTGDPNFISNEVKWPLYNTKEKRYLEIGIQKRIRSGPQLRQCAFWNKLLPDLYDHFADQKTCKPGNTRG